jgi:hypothetical protein
MPVHRFESYMSAQRAVRPGPILEESRATCHAAGRIPSDQVRNLHRVAAAHFHMSWLGVPVHDPPLVRMLEGFRKLLRDAQIPSGRAFLFRYGGEGGIQNK